MRKVPKAEQRRRVEEIARVLGLGDMLHRRPAQLSGGQRQRVAMGRAIVREPKAFLMDEPLSNLDAKLRVQMRAEIARIQQALAVTTLYVTHDQVEAMTMGDRVAVMRKGELQQVASPEELYDKPVNLFVGGFIGSPAMNMIEVKLERSNGALEAVTPGTRLRLGDETLSQHPALKSYEGREVVLGVRPEDLEDASLAQAGGPRLKGKVELREALGSEVLAHFTIAARQAVTEEVRELAKDVGDDRTVDQLEADMPAETTLVGRFGARSRVREGDAIDIAVDTRALHFFDPETGLGIYDQPQGKEGT